VIIPYTTERRADTGMTNVRLGMWLFIASEIMLFGALFSAYALLRSAATNWPPGRNVLSLPLGATNTVVLLALTTLVWRARNASTPAVRRFLVLATVMAGLFLALKSTEYVHDFSTGLLPRVSTFMAMYFTLTMLHAAHVIAGAVANAWVMAGTRRAGDAMTAGRLRALSVYWAFVDVVWLLIFVLMYLS
jgi:cytochrome c oxidase subunit 3